MTATLPEKVYKPAELAEEWQLSEAVVRKYIRQKRLRAVKFGHVYRVRVQDAVEFLERNLTSETAEVEA